MDSMEVANHIRNKRRMRVAYRRQSDEMTGIHNLAPLDVRAGDSRRTQRTLYLWAWCYSCGRAEMLLISRIDAVTTLDESFDPAEVMSRWPRDRWPLAEWTVSRDW